MRSIAIILSILAFQCQIVMGQVITADPEFPTDNKSVTITFDATKGNGGLAGYTGDVYAHAGVITDKSTTDSDWKYVLSEWNVNIDKAKLTRISADLYEFEITPDIRSFYNVPAGEVIEKLSFVFRSADGSKVGKDNGDADIFYEVYEDKLSVMFTTPQHNSIFDLDAVVDISVSTSEKADIELFVNNVSNKELSDTTSLSSSYTLAEKRDYWFKAVATVGTESVSDSIFVIVKEDAVSSPLPAGMLKGVNYTSASTATFVLWAPDKEYVFLLGDFNGWHPYNEYQMKKDGDYYWLEIDNLEAGKQYVYQYYIDGKLKIADPYTEQVSDPAHDKFISEETYPGLVNYPMGKTEGVASVAITGQTSYTWEVEDFTPVSKEKLVVYECLVRDFTEERTYKALVDKLDYLQDLGINALELMPVNEFEGNESWGYNPSFYFAPDKYYGPKNELKKLVDECHKRGIAVILDIVLNHSFSQSPFAQMYLEGGKPADNNPWYNREHNMVDNTAAHWGYDFNHESEYTKELIDSVNGHWLREYKIDGFRFDFTKGFTNTIYRGSDNWASTYDADRIAILKRMSDEIWKRNSNAFIIFEHLSDNSEEKELADYGIMLWGNINHNYAENAMAWHESNKSDLSWGYHERRGWSEPNLVSYAESHDEERVMYKCLQYGNSAGSYDITQVETALERVAANAALHVTIPGPKMLWQFQELGYDFSIDYNGRTGNKPVKWDYFDDANRKALYNTMASINSLKTSNEEFYAPDNFEYDLDNGAIKTMTLSKGNKHAVIVGNFDVVTQDVAYTFPATGTYYDYFSGTTISVENVNYTVSLAPGSFKIYTTTKYELPLSDKEIEGAIKKGGVYPNPASDEIFIQHGNIDSIEIYNTAGQLVKVSSNINDQQNVNVSDLQSGLYFIKLTNSDHQVYTDSFLKK